MLYNDNNIVPFLSTFRGIDWTSSLYRRQVWTTSKVSKTEGRNKKYTGQKDIPNPLCKVEYEHYMGGVDRFD